MDNLSQTATILPKRRFIRHNFYHEAWQNLWSSVSYGYFDSQQNGTPVDVSAKMVSYSCFNWNKYDCTWGTKVPSRCYNTICLTYARDWWAVIGPVIHGESKSEATRSSSDHVDLLHTLSTIDTQKSKLRVRFLLEVLAKLMARENSSWEFPQIGVCLVLEVRLTLERKQ